MPQNLEQTRKTVAGSGIHIDEILENIKDLLVTGYNPDKIILFGSFACGNPNEHSDIDIFIVKETPVQWIDRFTKVKEILFDPHRGIPVSPIVMTPSEVSEKLRVNDAFLNQIFSEGRLVYERNTFN